MNTTTTCPVALPAPGTLIKVQVPEETDSYRKARIEGYHWTFVRAELAEDGCWYAVITREEVNSYNDVMNGSGTGLGTHTVTERAKLTD